MADRVIRYRCPTTRGAPLPRTILHSAVAAYRVLRADKGKNCMPMLGFTTWLLQVERIPLAAGLIEIAAGMPGLTRRWEQDR